MKNACIMMLVLCCCSCGSTYGQSTWFKEWFRQKKTQKEYLINQIAALQVYIGYARKGYSIYREGLGVIGDLKDGEFRLHETFFDDLERINPDVARYGRIADIVRLQVATVKAYSRTLKTAKAEGGLRPDELVYLLAVYNRLLDDCAGMVDALIALTTSGALKMADDERLKRIDRLHTAMTESYAFAVRFGDEAIALGRSRKSAQHDQALLHQLFNPKID